MHLVNCHRNPYLGTKYDKLEGFRYHVGVYGLVTSNGRILLVQKTRGPYLGQLDLPGGSPCIGECKNETLHREMLEEVGSEIAAFGPWHQIDFLVNRDSKNKPLKLRHFGSIREVKCLTEIDTNIFCEDVGGAVWIALENWGGKGRFVAFNKEYFECTISTRKVSKINDMLSRA